MKNLFLLAAALLFLASCRDEPKTEEPAKVVLSESEEMDRLNEYMARYKTPPQTFTISSDKPTTITGDKGSKWHIDPANLVTESGQPVTGEISIALIELNSTADFLRNDLQTVTKDGKLLASGGSYYIGMSANGQRLKLKEGKSIDAELPKITEEDMELFYGSRDDMDVMSWEETGKDFKTAFEIVKEEQKTKDTAWMTIDGPKKKDVMARVIQRNGQVVRPAAGWNEDDAIDSVMSYKNGKHMTDDQKEKSESYQKAKKIAKNIYQAIQIEELGWLNVDRFLKSSLVPMYVSTEGVDSSTYVKIYAVFKGIKSLVQGSFFGNEYVFNRMPQGSEIKLIAYGFRNDKIFFDTKELKIEGEQPSVLLAFREATENDINAFFE